MRYSFAFVASCITSGEAELTPRRRPSHPGRRQSARPLADLVRRGGPEHPGKVVAFAIAADPHGGTRLPGLLVADTLDELRAMLPSALKRSERTPMLPAEVVEFWDTERTMNPTRPLVPVRLANAIRVGLYG